LKTGFFNHFILSKFQSFFMKKTVVLGATPNPNRYAHAAATQLLDHGHEVVPIGIRKGNIGPLEILNDPFPSIEDVDTVTLYLNPQRQQPYYDYILHQLRPHRIIFNPGTENPELVRLATAEGIETELACTLVMLAVGNY
jgi:predicted CoA-binding protein